MSALNNSKSHRRKKRRIKGEFICTYDDCDKVYSSLCHLIRHEEIHSETPYTLKCTEKNCGKLFKTKATLKKHVDNVHLKKNPKVYKCPHCSEEFNKHSWLTRHEFKHTGIKPYACPNEGCEKRFEVPSKLKRHMKIHQGYTCTKENCGKTFAKWSLYTMHQKLSHSSMFKCDNCGMGFSRSNNLKDHMKVHKLDRQVFACPKPNCMRFYFAEKNLNHHIKSYHDKRPFVCTQEHCPKAFKSEADMVAHSSRHEHRRRRKRKGKPKPSFAARLAGLAPKKWQLEIETEQSEPDEESAEDCSTDAESSFTTDETYSDSVSPKKALSEQTVESVSNLAINENSTELLPRQIIKDIPNLPSAENSNNYEVDEGIKMLLNMIDDRNKLNIESSVKKTECISLKA